MQHELIFAGFGGQGIMFAGQLLAYAAMDQGYNVTWIPSYGPEMRGGTAYCCVVVSDEPIGSPVARHPEVALVFNQPSFDRFAPIVAPDGLLVYNSSLIKTVSEPPNVQILPVPATELATELGDLQMTNMVMLAATLGARAILPLDAIRAALEAHLPAHRRDKLPLNMKAIDAGVKAVALAT